MCVGYILGVSGGISRPAACTFFLCRCHYWEGLTSVWVPSSIKEKVSAQWRGRPVGSFCKGRGYSNVERPCATICVMSGVAFLRWCAYCCCCCLLRRFLTMWMQMKDITIRPSATASSSFACIIASSSVIVRVCLVRKGRQTHFYNIRIFKLSPRAYSKK